MSADPFEAENAFYLTAGPMRMGKLLAQADLYRRTVDLPGAIVECGVYKGASLARLAMFRALFSQDYAKPLIAFDTFGHYVEAPESVRDADLRANVVRGGGETGISVNSAHEMLAAKRCERNVDLVPGDIRETVPRYVRDHPELRISFLNLDVDFAPATETILTHLYPRLVRGGVLLLDDYGVFEGETDIADGFFRRAQIRRFPFAYSPSYLVKED